jgi:CheY-like chemotaxis protein
MPGLDGREVCRRIRAESKNDYVYVLLMTSKGDAGDLVTGMEADADDYETKPFDPRELKLRASRIRGTVSRYCSNRLGWHNRVTNYAHEGLRRFVSGSLNHSLPFFHARRRRGFNSGGAPSAALGDSSITSGASPNINLDLDLTHRTRTYRNHPQKSTRGSVALLL